MRPQIPVLMTMLALSGCVTNDSGGKPGQDGSTDRGVDVLVQVDRGPRDTSPMDISGQDSASEGSVPDSAPLDAARDAAGDSSSAPDTGADTRPDTRPDVAADTLSPDTLSPDTLSPDTLSPDTLSPDTLSPDTLSPDTLSPDTGPKPCTQDHQCDDGLACTTNTCSAQNLCTHTIDANSCLLSGACYASGDLRPGNICQHCLPQISQTMWWTRAGTCDDGDPNTYDDACSWGVCKGKICDDGLSCTDNNLSGNTCTHTRKVDHCHATPPQTLGLSGLNHDICGADGAGLDNPGVSPTQYWKLPHIGCVVCVAQTNTWMTLPVGSPCAHKHSDGNTYAGTCTTYGQCLPNPSPAAGGCFYNGETQGPTFYVDFVGPSDICRGGCGTTCFVRPKCHPTSFECVPCGSEGVGPCIDMTTYCRPGLTVQNGVCLPPPSDGGAIDAQVHDAGVGDGPPGPDQGATGVCSQHADCDDNLSCTLDLCLSGTVCNNRVDDNSCSINGACYSSGQLKPGNVCYHCLPAINQTDWSTRNGYCDDGNPNTINDRCSAGVCKGTPL